MKRSDIVLNYFRKDNIDVTFAIDSADRYIDSLIRYDNCRVYIEKNCIYISYTKGIKIQTFINRYNIREILQ